MKTTIYDIADDFVKKLNKLASFPDQESIYSIVERVVDSVKSESDTLSGIKTVAKPIDVQSSGENIMYVYFQLILSPSSYQQLFDSNVASALLKTRVEKALNTTFPSFQFKIKIGMVPE